MWESPTLEITQGPIHRALMSGIAVARLISLNERRTRVPHSSRSEEWDTKTLEIALLISKSKIENHKSKNDSPSGILFTSSTYITDSPLDLVRF
jgi:hypothetical protein